MRKTNEAKPSSYLKEKKMATVIVKDEGTISTVRNEVEYATGGKMKTATLREKTAAVRGLDVSPGREFDAFDDVLAFAIEDKTRAYDLYSRFAERARQPWTRQAFDELAADKLKQRDHLERVKRAGELRVTAQNVQNLKIADYVTADVRPAEDTDTREALIFAIRVERDTLRLYTDLADHAGDTEIQSLFLALAQEQAQHLLKLETEYEDHVFAQN
jgi:rubrerythrin